MSVPLKPLSLLLLRIGSGLLLVLWGSLRVMAPEAGPGLADKYYGGLLNLQSIQMTFGAAEMVIGALVVLGLFRRIAYPLQALILVPGALMLWRYLLDPMGRYLLSPEDSQILFFPSITLAAASIALIAFRDEDRWALDAARAAKRATA
jgi:putative oxidoreductase